MTHQPPIPEASKPPFPTSEAPHFDSAARYEDEADDGEGDSFSLTALLDDYGIDTRTAIGIGAAVGLGAIAGISALLFSRGRKTRSGGATRGSAKRKTATRSAAKPRKPRTAAKSARSTANGSGRSAAAKA